MPLYDYQCKVCKHADEEFFKIASSAEPRACPKCGADGSYERQVSLPHSDLIEFHKPIEMFSIAMEDPEEIKRFITKTGVAVSLDPSDPLYGVPIARNRSEKRKALNDAGFEERS